MIYLSVINLSKYTTPIIYVIIIITDNKMNTLLFSNIYITKPKTCNGTIAHKLD